MKIKKDRRPEPIWTGRYGDARLKVIEHGRDFHVVNVTDGASYGIHVFLAEANINPDELFGAKNWTDQISPMRAYNAEDAARNWWGAISQWHVWINYPKMDWETAPFTDENGNFPPDGGDHGGEGYDASPPDETAAGGITRPDLFNEHGGYMLEKAALTGPVSADHALIVSDSTNPAPAPTLA